MLKSDINEVIANVSDSRGVLRSDDVRPEDLARGFGGDCKSRRWADCAWSVPRPTDHWNSPHGPRGLGVSGLR